MVEEEENEVEAVNGLAVDDEEEEIVDEVVGW